MCLNPEEFILLESYLSKAWLAFNLIEDDPVRLFCTDRLKKDCSTREKSNKINLERVVKGAGTRDGKIIQSGGYLIRSHLIRFCRTRYLKI